MSTPSHTPQPDSEATPTLGRRERKKLATRQAVFESGLRLFAKRGFNQTTVAAIAEAADVSESTVFFHFSSKEDLLFDHVINRGFTLATALAAKRPEESTLDVIRRYIDQARSAPEGVVETRVLMSHILAVEPDLMGVAVEKWTAPVRPALLRSFTDEFQGSGELTPKILTGLTIGMIQEFGRLQQAEPHRRDLFTEFIDAAMTALVEALTSLTSDDGQNTP